MKRYLPQSGFTLIEILVVLLIIGTLSAVIFANFSDARVNSKNKAIKSDLKEMQLALELYKSQNGSYPDIPTPSSPCGTVGGGVRMAESRLCAGFGGTDIITGLAPDYVDQLLGHAKGANSNCNIIYMVEDGNRSWYKLIAANCYGGATSAATGVGVNDDLARCPTTCPASGSCNPANADFYESYAVYSAGGQCQ